MTIEARIKEFEMLKHCIVQRMSDDGFIYIKN